MSHPPKLRAVALIRVSSQIQRERFTIDSQLRVLTSYITSQGWDLVRPIDHYKEDGQSARTGKLAERDVIARLLADAEAGQFDVVAVVDDERLTRTGSLLERLKVYGRLQDAHVKIAFAHTNTVVNLDHEMDQLMTMLKSWQSSVDNRKRADAIKRGAIEAIHRGNKPRGQTPYGFVYTRPAEKTKLGTWALDPERAQAVRTIYSRVLAGQSLYRISVQLNAEGAPRPKGGRWYRDRVRQIVTNTAYRGVYVADKARGLTIPVPRVVEDEVWYAAQTLLATRRVGGAVMPRAQHEAALCEGIARCGVCGGRIRIQNNKKRRAYACWTKKASTEEMVFHNVTRRCPNPSRIIAKVDELVWAHVLTILRDPATFDRSLAFHAETEKAHAGRDVEAELAGYERRLARLARAESEILTRFQRGKISPAAMDLALDQAKRDRELLERNRDLLRAELAAAARSQKELKSLLDTARELAHRLEDAAPSERRDLLRLLVPGEDGYYVTFLPDRVELLGRLEAPAASVGPGVSRAAAAGSYTGRSGDIPFRLKVPTAARALSMTPAAIQQRKFRERLAAGLPPPPRALSMKPGATRQRAYRDRLAKGVPPAPRTPSMTPGAMQQRKYRERLAVRGGAATKGPRATRKR